MKINNEDRTIHVSDVNGFRIDVILDEATNKRRIEVWDNDTLLHRVDEDRSFMFAFNLCAAIANQGFWNPFYVAGIFPDRNPKQTFSDTDVFGFILEALREKMD